VRYVIKDIFSKRKEAIVPQIRRIKEIVANIN